MKVFGLVVSYASTILKLWILACMCTKKNVYIYFCCQLNALSTVKWVMCIIINWEKDERRRKKWCKIQNGNLEVVPIIGIILHFVFTWCTLWVVAVTAYCVYLGMVDVYWLATHEKKILMMQSKPRQSPYKCF